MPITEDQRKKDEWDVLMKQPYTFKQDLVNNHINKGHLKVWFQWRSNTLVVRVLGEIPMEFKLFPTNEGSIRKEFAYELIYRTYCFKKEYETVGDLKHAKYKQHQASCQYCDCDSCSKYRFYEFGW